MSTRQTIKSLLDIFDSTKYKFVDDEEIEISKTDFPDISDRLDNNNVEFRPYGKDAVRFVLKEIGENVFIDESHFLREIKNYEDLLDNEIHIIQSDFGYMKYSHGQSLNKNN